MTVAFDAVTAGTGTGTISVTHTPVGTPKGVLLLLVQYVSATAQVSTVTYGGVSMTQVSTSPADGTGLTDAGMTYAYFLGSGIPTGAQTVEVTVSNSANKRFNVFTITGAADTEVVDSEAVVTDSVANPSTTLSLGGRDSWVAVGFGNEHNAVPSISPLSGWTDTGEVDFGLSVAGYYRYNTVSTSDVTAGYTATANDSWMMAVAISEVAASAETSIAFRRAFPLPILNF